MIRIDISFMFLFSSMHDFQLADQSRIRLKIVIVGFFSNTTGATRSSTDTETTKISDLHS